MHRIRTSLAGIALVASITGCSHDPTSSAARVTEAADGTEAGAQEADLVITTFSFSPASLSVPAGASVVVTNGDPTTHTVTAGTPDRPTGAFDVRLTGKGSSGRLGPLAPGTYAYFCRIHTSMTGRLVVG